MVQVISLKKHLRVPLSYIFGRRWFGIIVTFYHKVLCVCSWCTKHVLETVKAGTVSTTYPCCCSPPCPASSWAGG